MKQRFWLLIIFGLVLSAPTLAQTTEYKRANVWQKEIAAFAAEDKKDLFAANGVIFTGSSTIRGWTTLKEDFPNVPILNRGFGGSHLADVIYYASEIVLIYKPNLIVLYAGENDLTSGETPETVFNDYKIFAALVHQSLPKTRLIYISLKPSPARWNLRSKFKETNDLIKAETNKDNRQQFVDIWQPMLNERGEPKNEIYQNDKLHLNAAGYKILRETLAPEIKKGLKGNFR